MLRRLKSDFVRLRKRFLIRVSQNFKSQVSICDDFYGDLYKISHEICFRRYIQKLIAPLFKNVWWQLIHTHIWYCEVVQYETHFSNLLQLLK